MLVFYLTFALIALAGMTALGGNVAVGAILLAVALAGVGMRLFCKGKLWIFSLCPLPLCLVLCLLVGQSTGGGTEDYAGQMRQIAAQIDQGNLDEGLELLDDLDEEFGPTDLSRYARAEVHLALEEYDKAQSCLNEVQDKSGVNWYEYMEQVYSGRGTEQDLEALKELYLSAAEDLPEDGRMQYMAGLIRLREGSYQGAAYYLRHARELNEKDGASCYYLGIISYELGKQAEASAYFAEALQRGVDEDKADNIRQYTEGGDKRDTETK